MIVRPPEYLDDVRERELEIQAAEARLAELGYHVCPYCDHEVEKDFLRCPNCMRKLKDPCTAAAAARSDLEDLPVLRGRDRGAAPQPRRARRRREAPPSSRRRRRSRRAPQPGADAAPAERGGPSGS